MQKTIRNQEIIAKFCLGKTQAELAREFGISRERIRQIVSEYKNGGEYVTKVEINQSKIITAITTLISESGGIPPTQTELAGYLGWSQPQVNSYLKRLQTAGLIEYSNKARSIKIKDN